MNRLSPSRTIPILAGVLLAACAPTENTENTEAPLYVQRDSAGIEVVENGDPSAAPIWSLSAEPSLTVGGMEAPDQEQLFRLTSALRLEDGRMALGNSGSHEVRILAPDGTRLASFGSEGEGPGEFMAVDVLGWLEEDSLAVWDQTLQRVSVVHVDDGVARTYPVEWTGAGFPVVRGLMDDGSVVIGGGMSFSAQDGFPTGVIRPESTFGWVSPGGGEVHLADLPAAEMFARANAQGFMARGLPFGRLSVAAAAPDGVWLGTSERYELRFFGSDGTLRRILRLEKTPGPVTAADVEAYIEENLEEDAAGENRERELRALIREMPIPEVVPPYGGLLVDTQGDLWVQDYPMPGADRSHWTVFDATGRLLARVEAPPRTELLEIGPDYVLGRTRDAFDVESLTLWSLTRGEG